MGVVSDYIKQLDKITPEAQKSAVLNIIHENVTLLIDLNTNQLMHGVDSNGEDLQPYRSIVYAELKRHLNPLNVTDLHLTGDFYGGWYVKTDKFPLVFGSTDKKTPELTKKYGNEIFGATDESKEIFMEYVRPYIQEWYIAQLRRK